MICPLIIITIICIHKPTQKETFYIPFHFQNKNMHLLIYIWIH